jgi:hypothetical protein
VLGSATIAAGVVATDDEPGEAGAADRVTSGAVGAGPAHGA